jgi:hypothetical protein
LTTTVENTTTAVDQALRDIEMPVQAEAPMMRPAPVGVFDNTPDADNIISRYKVRLEFPGLIMGGTPNKADLIAAWIRTKAGITDEQEVQRMLKRTIAQRRGLEDELRQTIGMDAETAKEASEADPLERVTYEQLEQASQDVAEDTHKVGFKRDRNGLFIESRQIKAGLKENTNILYAGQGFGVTKKSPKSFVAERVFVEQDRVYLGRMVADSNELFVGHVTGPQGPRHTLTLYEYCQEPIIDFTIVVLEDALLPEHWRNIWIAFQLNGLGALRSQGHGRFKITEWEKLNQGTAYDPAKGKKAKELAAAGVK